MGPSLPPPEPFVFDGIEWTAWRTVTPMHLNEDQEVWKPHELVKKLEKQKELLLICSGTLQCASPQGA